MDKDTTTRKRRKQKMATQGQWLRQKPQIASAQVATRLGLPSLLGRQKAEVEGRSAGEVATAPVETSKLGIGLVGPTVSCRRREGEDGSSGCSARGSCSRRPEHGRYVLERRAISKEP